MKKFIMFALMGFLLSFAPIQVCQAATDSSNVSKGKALFDKLARCAERWDRESPSLNSPSLTTDKARSVIKILFDADKYLIEATSLLKKLSPREEENLNRYVRRKLDNNPGLEQKIKNLKDTISALGDYFEENPMD